ncbi:GtrA family protein [Dickeya sp. CFBP 2040]|uniref:GtrA family protein n=1 Tax=Dickeya sp. CFBP 2040 TaxID=2718531 RepID=UPI001FF0B0E4|nr:GtrA family protein [Dickeya sp. CFBP 2040]
MLSPRSAFMRYLCTGGINTLIHWSVFLILTGVFTVDQAVANLSAFCVAVSCSYVINARWTFRASVSLARFGLYVGFMAILAGLTGYAGQHLRFPALLTLVLFSAVSLVFGYLYARCIVFREPSS